MHEKQSRDRQRFEATDFFTQRGHAGIEQPGYIVHATAQLIEQGLQQVTASESVGHDVAEAGYRPQRAVSQRAGGAFERQPENGLYG